MVGISFRDEVPVGIPMAKFQSQHCHFIGKAREGDIFYAQKEDISCPLARFYLGIGNTDLRSLSRILVGWDDSIDEEIALEYLRSARNLKAGKNYIVYFPYPQENLKPDVIIKIGTSNEIMAIIQRFSSLTGRRVDASLSGIGAACGECTAYPLITERENVSLGCYGSRPGIGLKEGELLLAFPASSRMVEICLGKT